MTPTDNQPRNCLARDNQPRHHPNAATPDQPILRGLGWDIDSQYSSNRGNLFPRGTSYGHTGFTGTSLWIDPDRDRYFVLLTNRACGGGTLDEMRTVRRAFHDALADV